MPTDITIHDYDSVYARLECDEGIAMEIDEYFTFQVDGFQFMPAFKRGRWDGRIRLFQRKRRLFYKGLIKALVQFASTRGHTIETTWKYKPGKPNLDRVLPYITKAGLKPYPHQVEAYEHCIRDRRALILSPTGSGKSLLIYMLFAHHAKKTKLLITPRTGLVRQMQSDFIDYGWDPDDIQIIDGTVEKDWQGLVTKSVVISTWQSIYKMPSKWYRQFQVVMVDEAHSASADSLKKVLTNCKTIDNRYGCTGTLDDSECNKLVIEGLLGPVHELLSTKEMMDEGILAPLNDIMCVVFKHSKKYTGSSYQDEIEFIISSEERNDYILKMAKKLKGNTIVLFNYVDKHGKVLYNKLKDDPTFDRDVFFVAGEVKTLDREDIRKAMEESEDAVLIASYGTFSMGTNIKNLDNLIFASPSKAKIRVLQSLGRILRKIGGKVATLVDISDDLRSSPNDKANYTLNHLYERIKLYIKQGFPYKVINIELGKNGKKEH